MGKGADGGNEGREQWKLVWQAVAGTEAPVFRETTQITAGDLGFLSQHLTWCVTLSKVLSFSGPISPLIK